MVTSSGRSKSNIRSNSSPAKYKTMPRHFSQKVDEFSTKLKMYPDGLRVFNFLTFIVTKIELMKTLPLLILLMPLLLSAQLSDNFSDGDFTTAPAWTGDADLFTVNSSLQLQLNASGEGISCLATPLDPEEEMEWRLWVRLNFSPSDNNHALIYLLSDQPALNEPLNGYYLKLGQGGSQDAIELYRKSGTVSNLIARGSDGLIANAFAIRLKVTLTGGGIWSIYADPAGGEDFIPEAGGNDNYWSGYSHFGILCKYTSSNATRFYFDDIYSGPPLSDTIPPALISASVSGTAGLQLLFSESVSESSASQPSNYLLNPGAEMPVAAGRDLQKKNLVHLLFQHDFTQNTVYTINAKGVTDMAGNTMHPAALPFAYHELQAGDVVISEIMADPDPVIGLPPCEYLEIMNRTPYPLQLGGWTLTAGSSKKTFPEMVLSPGGFLILSSEEAARQLKEFGEVVSFSSLSLSNTGTSLVLRNDGGAIIHMVTYSDSWYPDALKKNGGWSLEMVDPMNPCAGNCNWKASVNPKGGTPGIENSVKGINPDTTEPGIEKIAVTGPRNIRLTFTEPADSLSLSDPFIYKASHGLQHPVAVELIPGAYRSVNLHFGSDFSSGIIYDLEIAPGISDCAGNTTAGTLTGRFAIPEDPEPFDLAINEVLSDARPAGSEFVEIYNCSGKVIDLKNIWLTNRNKNSGETGTPKETAPDGRLLFPGEYLALTAAPEKVRSEYFSPGLTSISGMTSFPSYPNEEGTVVLITPWNTIIDEFSYSAGMHFPLLRTTDGVSLERVNYNRPASERDNWHSASQSCGFATPGYRNSQFLLPDADEEIGLTPEIFSPDNDGFDDLLAISFSTKNPGNSITIRIFDSSGRMVRLLAGNHPAGTENIYYWDGITERQTKAPAGIYIVHAEIFDMEGNVRHFKKAAVVAAKMNR